MAEPVVEEESRSWWETSAGRIVGLAVLLVVSVFLIFGNLSQVGVWEPWEANEILVAEEYAERGPAKPSDDPTAPSYNWAVPTSDKKPVERPLLKTWLLSAATKADAGDELAVGDLEFSARLPIATLVFLFTFAAFFWIRRYFGTWPAVFTSVVFVTSPAIFIGAHNVASEMTFVVTTSLAIMTFAQMVYAERFRWAWGLAFGGSLALSFLDQRLLGLYLPIAVVVSFALTELAFSKIALARAGTENDRLVGPIEIGGAVSGVVSAAATILWGIWRSSDAANDGLFLPHVEQWVWVFVPLFLLLGGTILARRTDAGKAILSVAGLLAAVVLVPVIAVVGSAYADANPVLLKGGEVMGKVPVLTYFLENHIFERSLASDHLTFDIWVRQIGFSLLPWVALLPLGLGYLSRATRITVDDDSAGGATRSPLLELLRPELGIKRLLLVWIFMATVVVIAFSAFGHYFYPAYFPIAAGIGLAMTDRKFWDELRTERPLVLYAIGFVACAIILMLGKDLQRFPARFIEVYLTLEKGFKLPEGFEFGSSYRLLKYAWMASLAVFFFGLVSWVFLTFRNLKKLPQTFRDWRERRRTGEEPEVPEEAAFTRRAREKEELRQGRGHIARMSRFFETPTTYSVLLLAFFTLSAGVMLYAYVPELTNHLSQRGVFATYQNLAEDEEELFRYQVSTRDTSVYLQDVPMIRGSSGFAEKFEADERFFAVIPRDRLAAINYEIRKKFDRNVPVLDARSSRLLLISNRYQEGEPRENFVADRIIEGEPDVEYPVQFTTDDGEMVHPVFDGKLEMLGYSLDTEEEKGGLPVYEWGEDAVITYYFRVKNRVPSSYKVFLHVDYPGNRINGDHYPNDGEFPTNYWLPGDIVTDVHHLHIDNYSTPGAYSMYFGFFLGSRRMKVKPDSAHDGGNRVMIGKIRVEP